MSSFAPRTSVSASLVQALTRVSVEGETGDRGDDQDYAGDPTTQGACPQERPASPKRGVDQECCAQHHHADGEDKHRPERSIWRAVCLPAADSVIPVAVFAEYVGSEQASIEERQEREDKGGVRTQAHDETSEDGTDEDERNNQVDDENQLRRHR